jgi:hypothetical protein
MAKVAKILLQNGIPHVPFTLFWGVVVCVYGYVCRARDFQQFAESMFLTPFELSAAC